MTTAARDCSLFIFLLFVSCGADALPDKLFSTDTLIGLAGLCVLACLARLCGMWAVVVWGPKE